MTEQTAQGPGPRRGRRLSRDRLTAIGVGIVAAGLIALFVTSGTATDPRATDTNRIVGRTAPDISATDTLGRPFRVQDYRGQWLLLNFFATWCTPCKVEHPELLAFSEEHKVRGDAAVASVAYNDRPGAVQEFFAENGGDWAVVADGESNFSIEYAVLALPESYLIDPNGRVVHKFTGGIRRGEVDAEIAKRS
ncbi:MAG: TlpA disulfide reductase family protein [Microthrixaceae bacterium]